MPSSFPIQLTISETEMAATLGSRRQIESLMKGLKDQHGFDGVDGWTVHIEGAGGELAVAKALGIYPVFGLNTFHAADLGKNLQVRTRSKSDYDLLIRPNDADSALFILVTGRIPYFQVRGWIEGKEAKKAEWLADYGGRPAAYFVKQQYLKDIKELDPLRLVSKAAPASKETPISHPF